MPPRLFLICLLTFVHYAAAHIRGPIVPLYAVAHGATAVGVIVGAHMLTSAVGSIPFGWAADVWGRRRCLPAGIAAGAGMSALLPCAESMWAMTVVYGLAGVGIAAFSPSALSLVGDTASPARRGQAFAWYATAHYGAIGIGPFVGGLIADRWSYRSAFVGSAIGLAIAFAVGLALPRPSRASAASNARAGATWASVVGNSAVWTGWTLAMSGLLVQGVVFTFLPLIAQERGRTPAHIGLVFLVLGLANTGVRLPAGWVIDRSGRYGRYAFGGLAIGVVATVLIPHIHDLAVLLVVAAVFGAASGVAFVAISVQLTGAAPAAARGLVMGGYSTALYLGLAVGAFALGPVITRHGYETGFAAGGALGGFGAVVAGLLRAWGGRPMPPSTPRREPSCETSKRSPTSLDARSCPTLPARATVLRNVRR
jgi:MFS family permease